MAHIPTQTANRLIATRGYYCEVSGCNNLATEAHHCLYNRKRGKKPMKELDMDENLQLVCEDCHYVTGKASSAENKLDFWNAQCERYGRRHMLAWHSSLPMKSKDGLYK